MKMSGSIRRTEQKLGRSLVGRLPVNLESSPRLTFEDGTSLPGLDTQHSGPGYFFASRKTELRCSAPKSIPARHCFALYFIPLERKSCVRATRSNFHE
jgi:hypothetical protein